MYQHCKVQASFLLSGHVKKCYQYSTNGSASMLERVSLLASGIKQRYVNIPQIDLTYRNISTHSHSHYRRMGVISGCVKCRLLELNSGKILNTFNFIRHCSTSKCNSTILYKEMMKCYSAGKQIYTGTNKYFVRNYSTIKQTNAGTKSNVVTLYNIFSESNKDRVQKKMQTEKPVMRPDYKHLKVSKHAAVLVPLCTVNGEPSLLFMVRSMDLKNHRGEVSFPGGMQDPGDPNITYTALRETFEEIGLPEKKVEIWGEMQNSPSKGGNWVTPVLGYCGEIDINQLSLNSSEVESVFTRTISSICDTANNRQTQYRYPGTKGYTIPVFTGGEYRIWGLTAVFIHQTLNLIAPGLYKFRLRHRS